MSDDRRTGAGERRGLATDADRAHTAEMRRAAVLLAGLVMLLTGCTAAAAPGAVLSADGASATVPGSLPHHSVTVHGVGQAGGPSARSIASLRREAASRRLPVPGHDLQSQVGYLVALFRGVLREPGRARDGTDFAALTTAPTSAQRRLAALVPADVRIDWGPTERQPALDRVQAAAMRGAAGLFTGGSGDTDAETGGIDISYQLVWGAHLTPAQVADRMAAAARAHGGLPVTLTVTDIDRAGSGVQPDMTPQHAGDAVLLRAARVSTADDGTGVFSHTGFTLGADGCVTLGERTVIAPADSSLDADGKHLDVNGVGRFVVGDGRRVSLGGETLTASQAAQVLPPGTRPCGAAPYVLLGR